METIPVHVELAVPHVQQSYQWDCGLACVKMVLGYLGKNMVSKEQYIYIYHLVIQTQ